MSATDMDETSAAQSWVISLLAADTALLALLASSASNYGDLAPEKALTPYTITAYQAGHDEDAANGARGVTQVILLVKAVTQDQKSFASAAAIARRIDLDLHGQSGAVDGWLILECRREQPVRYFEVDTGKRYNHLGRTYRIWIQAD